MIANMLWHESLRDALVSKQAAVLVVVAAAAGSTPREAGAAMVVTSEGLMGTIGGGHLEYEALRLARAALRSRTGPAQWLVRFPLAARLGQCCGGVATLAFAILDGRACPWLDAVAAHVSASRPFAVVSTLASGDSAALRLVTDARHAAGTLGDSALDATAIAKARDWLSTRPPGATLLDLDGTTLLVPLVQPAGFDVLVFGNGHVGRALVQVLAALPCQMRWIDTRENDFPGRAPDNAVVVVTDSPEDEIAAAPQGAYVVVMTHSHALDYQIIDAALHRDDWRYLGLIGSRSKRAQFERRFSARGRPREALARLTCPIGLSGLYSKEPGVIAVAVAAQLLEVRQASVAPAVRMQQQSR